MASTEHVLTAGIAPAIERVTELDPATLAMLNELVAQAHWNQTGDDWRVFFANGSIHVIRDEQGRIVASGAVLPMGPSRPGYLAGLTGRGVAWISMILVTPECRRAGLGRHIFDQCLRQIQGKDRIAMLDATPAGEALYTKFGFEALWRFTRWRREASPATKPELPFAMPDVESLAELDQEALGFSRIEVLQALLTREDSRFIRHPLGFAIVRAGRVAHHIGPLVATNEDAAIGLLQDAAARFSEPLLIDVPDERPLLRGALVEAGFTPQRSFARMAYTTAEQRVPIGQTHFVHAVAGPEFA